MVDRTLTTPGGASPSVLRGPRPTVAGTAKESTPVAPPGSTRPGSTPSVLHRGNGGPGAVPPPTGRPVQPKRNDRAEQRSLLSTPESGWVGVEDARAAAGESVVDSPQPTVDRDAARLAQMSGTLRPTGSTSRAPAAEPRGQSRRPWRKADVAARHVKRDEVQSDDAAERGDAIVTDEEAFTVDGPGGPVLREVHREDPVSYREPGPTIGG
jgi:hypothetical protein